MISIDDEFIEKIDSMLTEEMILNDSPGLSIGIISGDQLVLIRNYGARDLESNIGCDSDTMYNIASVTKSFVCVALLKLQEMGKLNIDDEVKKYIPLKLGLEGHPIKIRHFMSHTSGMPDLGDTIWLTNEEERFGMTRKIPKVPFATWDDIYRHLNGASEYITDPPGTRFYYNNIAYELLSQIISKVSGQSFTSFIKEHILNPLEMSRSSFMSDELLKDNNIAIPYESAVGSKTGKINKINYSGTKFISAAGGLFSTINELSNYAIMHLNDGYYKGNQIITSENLSQMQDFQFTESYPNADFTAFYGDYGKTGYGFGLAIHDNFFGYKLVQHSGSYMGSSAWFALIPEKKIGAVFLSNKHPSPRMLAQVVLMMLLGKDPETDHNLLNIRAHHKKLTGKYETYRSLNKMQIISRGGALFYSIGEKIKNPLPIYPIPEKTKDPENLDYYVPTEIGGLMPFQFEIRDDQTWIHMERDKWKKVNDWK